MIELIRKNINEKKPINLIGFWGASDKKEVDKNDNKAIENNPEFFNRMKYNIL